MLEKTKWEYSWQGHSDFHAMLSKCEDQGDDGWELVSVTFIPGIVAESDMELTIGEVYGMWRAVLKRKKSS